MRESTAGAERPVTTSASTSIPTASVVVVASSSSSSGSSLSAGDAATTTTTQATQSITTSFAHDVDDHAVSAERAHNSDQTADTEFETGAAESEDNQSETENKHKNQEEEEEEENSKFDSFEPTGDVSALPVDEEQEEENINETEPQGRGNTEEMDPRRNNAIIAERNAESKAATKIQASFRGYQVRKQMQKPKVKFFNFNITKLILTF